MNKFWKEFKEFAFKGNVVDLAVGMIIGSAFTAIVNGLVNSIIMPLFSLITGKLNFSEMNWMIGETAIPYGEFLQAVINFFIVALCIFAFIKAINKMKKPAPAAPAKAPRICPFCKMEIADDATRCPHCTSELKK